MDREALEQELAPPQLAGLAELCRDLGCAFEAWPRIPAARGFALLCAGRRLVLRLERESLGLMSRRAAVRAAAAALGVTPRCLASALDRAQWSAVLDNTDRNLRSNPPRPNEAA